MVQFNFASSPSWLYRALCSCVFVAFVFLCLAFFSTDQSVNAQEIVEEKIEAPIFKEVQVCLRLSFVVIEEEKDHSQDEQSLLREVYHMDIPTPPPEFLL